MPRKSSPLSVGKGRSLQDIASEVEAEVEAGDPAPSRDESDSAAAIRGLHRALDHAELMRNRGQLSKTECRDMQKMLMREYIERMPMDEFAEKMDSGQLDKLYKETGYDDGEDPEVGGARREAVMRRVAANLLAGGAHSGAVKHADAIAALRDYVDLGDDADADPEGAIAAIFEASSVADKQLDPPKSAGLYKPWLSDEEDARPITADQAAYLTELENEKST